MFTSSIRGTDNWAKVRVGNFEDESIAYICPL